MSYRAVVALGSNLGNRLANLQGALTALRRVGTIEAISPLYETVPVGGPPQGHYLNAVVLLSADAAPQDLLDQTQRIETEAGRERKERWGPRTLDLDLILVVGEDGTPVRMNSVALSLPHPRAHRRRFVLEPLAQVWPEAPLGGVTAETALRGVSDQGVTKVADRWAEAASSWISPALLATQLALFGIFAVVTWFTRGQMRLGLVVAGGVVAAAGLALGMWSVWSLGAAFSPFPEPLPGAVLVDHGPYRRMRHPIYSAVVLAMAGSAAALSSPAGLAVTAVAALFFWFKAGYEERRLRLLVPGYSSYADRVRGRLLPR